MTLERRECWYNSEKTCYCENSNDCIELSLQHARLVYCSDGNCIWNQQLPEKVKVDRGTARAAFVDETDYATGVCTRAKGVFLAHKERMDSDNKTKRKDTVCLVRSDKTFRRMPTVHPDQIEWVGYDDPNQWV